jgi:hypothetical protein
MNQSDPWCGRKHILPRGDTIARKTKKQAAGRFRSQAADKLLEGVNHRPEFLFDGWDGLQPQVWLDADGTTDQNHPHPTIHPLPFDDEGLANKRSDIHHLANLSVLPWQNVIADASQCGL